MFSEQLISSCIVELNEEILPNPANEEAIAKTNSLIYTKHEKNSDHIRKELLVKSIHDEKIRESLSKYTDEIVHGKFLNDKIIHEAQEALKKKRTRRLSIDFHNADDIEDEDELKDQVEDENLKQLKERLLQGSKSKDSKNHAVTFDKQLENEESKQEDILKDMFQFIQGIKDGANEFNEKLNQDQNVLKAAEAGLEMTSAKLIKSRNNLSKTISQLGLLDSLKIFGLVIFSFILCLILIKLFPKW